MSQIRTTKNTIWGPFIAYIHETGRTYDSTFVFVFICIKGNIRGWGGGLRQCNEYTPIYLLSIFASSQKLLISSHI